MRQVIKILVFTLAFVLAANGQASIKDILLPTAADLSEAQTRGFEVFKILPRGMFGYERNELSVRGGGAYYSFVKKSHSYNEIPQIEFRQNMLLVGFHGANYGLIADLGTIPLAEISPESKEADFLLNYQPPKYELAARAELQKVRASVESGKLKYNQYSTAVVGHTYLLRVISYEAADTFVAFQIHRKDADGGLIIFWKTLKQFEKPLLLYQTDEELAAKLQKISQNEFFREVKFEVKDNVVVLRGKVPNDKINELLSLVNAEKTRGLQILLNQ